MYPWLWFWAPQLHLPLSGDVAQRIDPDWFFGAIPRAAGNGRIERKATGVASYGRQLGLLTEVVLALAAELEPADDKTRAALTRLRKIAKDIEALKDAEYAQLAASLAEQARELRAKRPRDFARLQAALADPALPE